MFFLPFSCINIKRKNTIEGVTLDPFGYILTIRGFPRINGWKVCGGVPAVTIYGKRAELSCDEPSLKSAHCPVALIDGSFFWTSHKKTFHFLRRRGGNFDFGNSFWWFPLINRHGVDIICNEQDKQSSANCELLAAGENSCAAVEYVTNKNH